MLQKIATLCLIAFLFCAACGNNAVKTPTSESSDAVELVDNGHQYFGEKINEANVIPIGNMLTKFSEADEGAMMVKTTGEVEAVCQVKGYWMTLKKPDGNTMRVTFKDYGFFMPTDIAGKEVIIEGEAKFDTTSVEMLRHYAEDEGLPQEEIEKITEPEIDISFIADGVILKGK